MIGVSCNKHAKLYYTHNRNNSEPFLKSSGRWQFTVVISLQFKIKDNKTFLKSYYDETLMSLYLDSLDKVFTTFYINKTELNIFFIKDTTQF